MCCCDENSNKEEPSFRPSCRQGGSAKVTREFLYKAKRPDYRHTDSWPSELSQEGDRNKDLAGAQRLEEQVCFLLLATTGEVRSIETGDRGDDTDDRERLNDEAAEPVDGVRKRPPVCHCNRKARGDLGELADVEDADELAGDPGDLSDLSDAGDAVDACDLEKWWEQPMSLGQFLINLSKPCTVRGELETSRSQPIATCMAAKSAGAPARPSGAANRQAACASRSEYPSTSRSARMTTSCTPTFAYNRCKVDRSPSPRSALLMWHQ